MNDYLNVTEKKSRCFNLPPITYKILECPLADIYAYHLSIDMFNNDFVLSKKETIYSVRIMSDKELRDRDAEEDSYEEEDYDSLPNNYFENPPNNYSEYDF